MLNYQLIFEKNGKLQKNNIKFDSKKKSFVKRYSNIELTSKHIHEIIIFLNGVEATYKNVNVPIAIELDQVSFYDKLSYIIFECIIYHYRVKLRKNISVSLNTIYTIWTDGIRYISLPYYKNIDEFDNKFKFDLSGRHYRKLVIYDKNTSKGNYLSKLLGDIKCYMINNKISINNSNELSEVLIELLGNGIEHGKSDTLIDIDITDSTYGKVDNSNSSYYGINVAIVTISEILFYNLLKTKLENRKLDYGKRYNDVISAFEKHKSCFNKTYSENDFYTIASFQDSISGDAEKYDEVGGKGLTRLLKSVEERSDSHLCYMLSGNKILLLLKEFLGTKNNYVGFNANGDFLNEPPSDEVVRTCDAYIPGVSYNLSFVIKKE